MHFVSPLRAIQEYFNNSDKKKIHMQMILRIHQCLELTF